MNVLREFLKPIPLCASLAGLLTAGLTGAWLIALLGFAASAAAVGLNLRLAPQDAASASKAAASQPPVFKRSYAAELESLGQEYQPAFKSLLKKRTQIACVLQDLHSSSILQLEQIYAQVEELVENYYGLLKKIEKVKPFTSSEVLRSVEAQIREIQSTLDTCDDDVMRQNLQMALTNKKDELERTSQLRQDRKRVMTQLMNVSAALQNIYVRLVHFSVSPQDFDSLMKQEITDQIEELIRGIQISENVAKELKSAVDWGTRSSVIS